MNSSKPSPRYDQLREMRERQHYERELGQRVHASMRDVTPAALISKVDAIPAKKPVDPKKQRARDAARKKRRKAKRSNKPPTDGAN